MRATSSPLRSAALWFCTAAVMGFLILPTLIVVPLSFSGVSYFSFPPPSWSTRWYSELFSSSDWITPIINTGIIGLAVSVCATVLGVPAAVALVRGRFRGRILMRHLLIVPMYVPVMTLAVGFYVVFARLGMIGSLAAIVLAHTVIAMPLVLLTVIPALETFDRRLEDAARSLGANPVVAFLRITVPLIRNSIVAGAVLAFAISFDELVIALFLSGTTAVTLPLRMWQGVQFEQTPVLAAAATFLLTGVMALWACSQLAREAGRRRGQRLRGGPVGGA